MKNMIIELARLYNKIINGTATRDDLVDYQLDIATFHMKKEVLISAIEKKAAELRRAEKKQKDVI